MCGEVGKHGMKTSNPTFSNQVEIHYPQHTTCEENKATYPPIPQLGKYFTSKTLSRRNFKHYLVLQIKVTSANKQKLGVIKFQ